MVNARTSIHIARLIRRIKNLKRRYFFEHQHDTDKLLQRTLPITEYNFGALIKGEIDDPSEVENLVGMINNLYAPLHAHQRLDQLVPPKIME